MSAESGTVPPSLSASLADRYTIARELGRGGMATVYLAEDLRHHRQVAVKVLRPELAASLGAERFLREIDIAARLSHPHIVPLHDSGEAGGFLYYVMPFIDGESLRARLLRGDPIPLAESVSILRDVALALEYAHSHGVVHRDIKPENVLFAGRTAVVADFGIAKAVSAARTEAHGGPSGTLTSAGTSLGTPAYMAPEQAAGDATDHRADLYAWGIIAYELLAGRHPFADKGTTAQLMAAQVQERPAPLVEKCPGLPPPLTALVTRCLEKDAGARPQNAGELLEALDTINSPSAGLSASRPKPSKRPLALAIVAVVVAMGAGGVLLTRRGGSVPPAPLASAPLAAPPLHSIAVLPFENLGDTADAYFADGITDAVRGKLMGLPGTDVIARGSSVEYRGTKKLPGVIAKELGVRYLLTGTVRFATEGGTKRVQVSPELVEITADGMSKGRWQEPVDAPMKYVFRVQGDIAGKVANAMRVALSSAAQAQLAKAPTEDPVAYDLYLRGEAAWNNDVNAGKAAITRALGSFEQAVARDSTMVVVWEEICLELIPQTGERG